MGFGSIARALPRGTRYPEPTLNENRHRTWMGGGFALTADGQLIESPGWGVEDELVLGIPAAWRAMNLIAGFISQLALRVYDDTVPNQLINPLPQVVKRPWPLLTYSDWMFAAVTSVVLRGNLIAVKADYDPASGMPRQLLPVHPDDVTMEMDDGYPWYNIVGMDRWMSWNEIFHARGYLSPGSLWGVGVIEAHRRGLRYSRTLADFGQQAYSNGGVPPVVIKVNKPELSDTEAAYIQGRWVARHASGNRQPAVIPQIMDVEKIGLSMQDAEYLQSRMFNVAEIAYMFNLAPEDLSASLVGSNSSLTYSNLDQKTRDRLLYTMQPIMVRIEQTYGDVLPGAQTARFTAEETMRMSFKERMDAYKVARETGVYTLDELRAMERQPPLPAGYADPMMPKTIEATPPQNPREDDETSTPENTEGELE
jgi:HK97 family phage portal protein